MVNASRSKLYDAIVVGSGASGSFAVKELTEGGLDVLLLEAGDLIVEKDFPIPPPDSPVATTKDRLRAALAGQRVQSRCTSFSPMTRHLFVNDQMNPYSTPKKMPYLWFRTRKLGGRLHLWGRNVMRWSDVYFKAADHDGCGENWPISYSEVEPFYEEVETFLGVYGSEDGIPHLPDSRYVGSRELTLAEQEFANILKNTWPERKIIPARTIKNNPARIPLPILSAQKTGRLTIQANSVVKHICIDSLTGKANGLSYVHAKTKKESNVRANVIVLSASPIESIRILLNSACPRYPAGIGNSSGVLGHYFMDHCPLLFFGPTGTSNEIASALSGENRDPWDLAQGSGFYIPRFRNISERRSDFSRGYAIHGAIGRTPNFWWLSAFGQMIPSFENHVAVRRQKRDAWGIPVARIECSRSQNDLAMAEDAKTTIRVMMQKSGLKILEESVQYQEWARSQPLRSFLFRKLQKTVFSEPHVMILGGGIHELGGARMGDDPRSSVLNRFNQCWDVKNIFVTDAASFPSSGEHHTLTTMALTIRACRYLIEEYRHDRL